MELLKPTNDYVFKRIFGQKKNSDILKDLLPKEFTLPEIQEVYETLLNKEFDRRNFRKQLLNKGIIEDVHKNTLYNGKKPAKMYKFCTTNKKDVF